MYILKSAYEYIVCEMAAILSRGRWVNSNSIFMDVLPYRSKRPCISWKWGRSPASTGTWECKLLPGQLQNRWKGRRFIIQSQWRHNERHGVSNHKPHECLLNCLFRLRSKKTSKLRVTGFCAGNSPVTGEFPAQGASDAENVSIWWRHHVLRNFNVKIHVSQQRFSNLASEWLAGQSTDNQKPYQKIRIN